MDYLQYCIQVKEIWLQVDSCFKPYYKWITFNTNLKPIQNQITEVLNLIINGLPSILYRYATCKEHLEF